MTTSTPDGFLLADKPAGVSSHDIVLAARRATGERRIGHAGTLDPFATGLLILLVGRATRLLQYIPTDPKVYEATIRFGSETDTEDPLGAVTRTAGVPDRAAVLGALPQLTGLLQQTPSTFSAKRVGGQRAYALARKGHDVQLDDVEIAVEQWDVLGWRGTEQAVSEMDVRVSCGTGTYVRALARDLGRLVGSAAHLAALRRTACGPFDVRDALTLADLRDNRVRLRPLVDALPHLPRQALAEHEVHAVARGMAVAATVDGELAALTGSDPGVLVALGERRGANWQPRAVMRPVVAEEGRA